MNVYLSQIYPEAGVNYPFTHRFQQFMSKALTERIAPSEMFVSRYGADFDLIFRMSAKSGITETDIKGPTIFKRTKDVEYTVFLPFDGNFAQSDVLENVLLRLLAGIVSVLETLQMDTELLTADSRQLANRIVSDSEMIE